MMVRGKKRAPAQKYVGGEPTPKRPAAPFVFALPIRGWVLNDSLATPQPGGASILDNWYCTTNSVRVRGGSARYANLGSAVKSLFSYRDGSTERMFGTTATSIYDLTVVADPDVTPTAAVSGQTSGYYSTQQFGTAGGDFLYAVNGTDEAQLYDGTTWTAINGASSPAITGVTTSTLSHVWSFANRVFFVEKDTMVSHYLGVDSIGGAASQFSLAGVFKMGGSLLFGATWSLDAGDGLDDKCVFVSTEGEIAVYEGTNPGNAATWSKVGVYQITKPLGQNAIMQAGGDLMIATESGFVPLSAAIRKDVAALSLSAVSAPIAPYWQDEASKASDPWEVIKWPQKNICIISQPQDMSGSCLVANLQTGAWSRFTGWLTSCLGFFEDQGFYGSTDGRVYRMENGGSDDGTSYTCSYLGLFGDMGVMGMDKTVLQMRARFKTTNTIAPLVTVKVNYDRNLSAAPNSPADVGSGGWDSGVWDVTDWDTASSAETIGRWVSVGRSGAAIAPEVQLTFGISKKPDVELVLTDATFEVGGLVV